MKLRLVLVFLFLIFAGPLCAEQNNRVGFAPFFITHPKFPCSAFLDTVKERKVLNLSVLYNTPGKSNTCISKIMKDKRLKTLQFHLINEAGHRNNRLEKTEFLYPYKSVAQYEKKLKKQDAKLRVKFFKYVKPLQNLLTRKSEDTVCIISPGLESNVSSTAGRILVRWSREAFPQCIVSWNSIKYTNEKTRIRTEADFIEGHSSKASLSSPCLVNLDGQDINFTQRKTKIKFRLESDKLSRYIKKYTDANCSIIYVWIQEYNCQDPKATHWSFPSQRTCPITPAYKELKSVIRKF